MTTDIETLIDLIRTHRAGDGSFSIPLDTALARLEVPRVDFYRRLYARRTAVATIAPDLISPETLFTFLAGACDDPERAESLLQARGAALSVDHQSELIETAVNIGRSAVASHTYDETAFSGIYAEERDRDRTIRRYLDYYFDQEAILATVCSRFVSLHPEMAPDLAAPEVSRVLSMLWQRHLLDESVLFAGVYRHFGFVPTDDEDDFSRTNAGGDPDDGVREHLEAMGLERLPEDPGDLKQMYRRLMKSFHPDVNPTGLEVSKRITRSYAVLVSAYREVS